MIAGKVAAGHWPKRVLVPHGQFMAPFALPWPHPAYGVADPKDLVLQVSPDFTHDAAIFTN
jgi:hypothetical protein